MSGRLAVFLKTMAGQAGESGSRGGKNHEFLNPIVGLFFWECKAGAAAAGFSNAVIEAACRVWYGGWEGVRPC